MSKVPVMVLRNKTNPERYLAASMDVGDWENENLDVTEDNIQNAYMIISKTLKPPTLLEFEMVKEEHARHKRYMIEKYGENACISLDFEGVCEVYQPVNIEITREQYEHAIELMEQG